MFPVLPLVATLCKCGMVLIFPIALIARYGMDFSWRQILPKAIGIFIALLLVVVTAPPAVKHSGNPMVHRWVCTQKQGDDCTQLTLE